MMLASTMDALRLQDLWRVMHPIVAEITHISHLDDCMARLDYLFGTGTLVPHVVDTVNRAIAISDDASVQVLLPDAAPKPQASMWRFIAYLLQEKF